MSGHQHGVRLGKCFAPGWRVSDRFKVVLRAHSDASIALHGDRRNRIVVQGHLHFVKVVADRLGHLGCKVLRGPDRCADDIFQYALGVPAVHADHNDPFRLAVPPKVTKPCIPKDLIRTGHCLLVLCVQVRHRCAAFRLLRQCARDLIGALEETAKCIGRAAPQCCSRRPHAWRSLKCVLKVGKHPVERCHLALSRRRARGVRRASLTVRPCRPARPPRARTNHVKCGRLWTLHPHIVLDFRADTNRMHLKADLSQFGRIDDATAIKDHCGFAHDMIDE